MWLKLHAIPDDKIKNIGLIFYETEHERNDWTQELFWKVFTKVKKAASS